jgi:release factor glutamine methyltransferase
VKKTSNTVSVFIMPSIKQTLSNAVNQLNTHLTDSDTAKLDVQLMLEHLLDVNHAWLISHAGDALTEKDDEVFQALLQRRLNGEPIAYILGEREFFGLPLKVTSDTLIPRPDTEKLVEVALDKIPDQADFLDLGTGTGAIALAIADNCPDVTVTAVDFSEKALSVAIDNAAALDIQNVTFLQSDWFDALDHQRFDVIVSNPPYIESTDAHLSQGDLRFEPMSALASGEDGLDDIRKILDNVLVFLKPQGWLLFEHGYNQSQAVQDLMADAGLVAVETIKDLGGNDRVTMGKNSLVVSTHWD